MCTWDPQDSITCEFVVWILSSMPPYQQYNFTITCTIISAQVGDYANAWECQVNYIYINFYITSDIITNIFRDHWLTYYWVHSSYIMWAQRNVHVLQVYLYNYGFGSQNQQAEATAVTLSLPDVVLMLFLLNWPHLQNNTCMKWLLLTHCQPGSSRGDGIGSIAHDTAVPSFITLWNFCYGVSGWGSSRDINLIL